MYKKFIIFSLLLLLAGTVMLRWVLIEKRNEQQRVTSYKLKYGSQTEECLKQYNEWLKLPPEVRTELPLVLDEDGRNKTEAQLRQEQQERLNVDMDKLATGEMSVYPFADALYGENWQSKVEEYKRRKEFNEFIFTSSIVCTSLGGAVSAGWILLGFAQLIIRGLSGLKKNFANMLRNLRAGDKKRVDIADARDFEQEQQSCKQQSQLEKFSKLLMDSSLQNPTAENQEQAHSAQKPWRIRNDTIDKVTGKKKLSEEAEKIAVLLSDEKTVEPKGRAKRPEEPAEIPAHSRPINNTLKELTQQVSAIRQYTAYQQDRLEKLQDGYDWNIVRTFCLRVIRCIDNLESRINELSGKDIQTEHLEEIKDELLFALESSGIEQFEPEINSDYRGQEKYAEAIKEKQSCDEPKQTGKIAQVVRPGYQYFINEDNIKVIRPAQVKLYA